MAKMGKDEVNQLMEKNPHLKKYVENIKEKMNEPAFYSPLPRELRDEEFPNLIYPTKGMVFVHVYRSKDMEAPQYKAIEPILDDVELEKHKQILELIVKKAPEKRSVVEDKDLKEVLNELFEETTIVGGLGSIISEFLVDNDLQIPLKRIGSPDKYCYIYGDREYIHSKYGLDIQNITNNILKWVK